MKPPKIFFQSNLKFLRVRKKISQAVLAETLGLSRSKLNSLENGFTKTPLPEDYVNFSQFYKISIDTLLKIDLSKLTELKIRQLEAGNDVYVMGGNMRVLAITVDKNDKENNEYVPIKAKAGYSAGYNDPEYIAQLPKFSLPNLPNNGSFRMFPIIGDSMLPIHPGSDIITEYVADWKDIKPQTLCIVILNGEQDFVFKQVTLQNDNHFLLESLNPTYKPYQVATESVLEIWKFNKYLTATIPEAEGDINQLIKMIQEIKSDINQLKK